MKRRWGAAAVVGGLALGLSCDQISALKEKLAGGSSKGDPTDQELSAAIELYRSGQFDGAAAALEAFVQARPTSADGFYYLGLSELAREPASADPASPLTPGEERSLRAFGQAINLNPRHARAYVGIGDLYARRIPERRRRSRPSEATDPYQQALEAYRQAVSIDPTLPEGQLHYARFLERTGELEEADRAYRAATEAAATVPEIAPDYYVAYGRFLSGRPGRLEDAMSQYELARMFRQEDLSIQRELAVLHGRMGQEYLDNQQYALAEQFLTKAYEMFPDKQDADARKVAAALQELRGIRRR